MPPSVASAPGSTGKKSPCSPAARSSTSRVIPAETVARQVAGGDLERPGEAGEVEADSALDRDHVALEARAGSERSDGNPVLAREGKDGRDGLRRVGIHDEIRPAWGVIGEVDSVQVAVGVACADGVGAECGGEGVAELIETLVDDAAHLPRSLLETAIAPHHNRT